MRYDPELDQLIGRGRLAGPIAPLGDPGQALAQPGRLNEQGMAALTRAISTATHPLRHVALGVLEDWDTLAATDQSAGLRLFAITRHPGHRLTRSHRTAARYPRSEL